MVVSREAYDMSSHGERSHAASGFPGVAAVSLETTNSLSWMLGRRVTAEDDRASLVATWDHERSRQQVSVFEVTEETAVVRHRSPVGRERYVGTTKTDAQQACADLDAAAAWRRVDGK
jgi:hypothetical protein